MEVFPMSHRYPDRSRPFFPSKKLLMNPHKGFSSFQRFRGDRLNENWSKETGWMMEEIPAGNLFCGEYSVGHPDPSLAYFRIPWNMLEPEMGVYDFTYLDFVLAEAARRMQKVILRFPPNAARPGPLDLPEWLITALHLPPREIGDKSTPLHPLFFDTYSSFIRAVAAHIDGDPRVSLVDMALISAWGEGAQSDMLTEAQWKQLVDAYVYSFKKTPLAGFPNLPQALAYANTVRPVGLRSDCIGDMNYHMPTAYIRSFSQFNGLWEKAPVAFEVCWVIEHWRRMGWDIDFIIEQSLGWHLTTFNAKSVAIPDIWMGKIEEWIRKMGYRFTLRLLDYPSAACPGDILHIDAYFQNLGVAPIYHRYPLVFRLRGENGACCMLSTEEDITAWIPGTYQCRCALTLPRTLPEGIYTLEVGITDGDTIVHLANDLPEINGFCTASEGIIIRAEENS